jgi:hypothetical protein
MQDLITNFYVKNIGIPLITIIVTILIKLISKNDKLNPSLVRKQDFAIGLDLGVTSLVILITNMVDLISQYYNNPLIKNSASLPPEQLAGQTIQEFYKVFLESQRLQNKLLESWLISLALIIGILLLALFVRTLGWEKGEQLNWKGIIFPNIWGVIALVFVVFWLNS